MKKTNEKKEYLSEIVFILDKSGSMSGLENDTIGGFNSMIKKQHSESGKCLVTTVLFSDTKQTIHDRIPLEEIKPMSAEDYIPMGCTALYDSVGSTITHISSVHKYIRKEDVPDKTVFVIITDGYENASKEFSHEALKRLIDEKKQKDNWEFMFIGANIDAVQTAESIGISREMSANYRADSEGTGVVYEAVCASMTDIRKNKKVSSSWAKDIENDLKKR